MIWARGLGLVGLGFFLASAFSPLPNVLSQRLAVPPRLEPADAIVVLGAGIRPDGSLSDASLRRALHGIMLYRKGLAPLLLFLGAPPTVGPGEAEQRVELARLSGILPAAILSAANAWTTREEAMRTEASLSSRGVHRILLVTNPHHMARARPLFERAGFEVLPAPSEDAPSTAGGPESRLGLTRRVLQEVFGRLYYRLAGYL